MCSNFSLEVSILISCMSVTNEDLDHLDHYIIYIIIISRIDPYSEPQVNSIDLIFTKLNSLLKWHWST